MAGGSLMYDTGNPKLELCDNQEGWSVEGGERGAQKGGSQVSLWLAHVHVWQRPSPNCKVIALQLK